MVYRHSALICLLAVGVGLGQFPVRGAAQTQPARHRAKPDRIDFGRDVKPLLTEYCYGCHGEKRKGGLDLRIYADEAEALSDRRVFEKMFAKLQAREMPPENKPQPTEAQRALVTNWVAAIFFRCDCEHPDPGRVTLRRLNRVEYNNTIRDLVGVDFEPAADFPADDTGYGFDNIGDVLSVSPVLVEKYLAAAETVLDAALGRGVVASGRTVQTNAWRRIMECDVPAWLSRSSPARRQLRAIPKDRPAAPSAVARLERARHIIITFAVRAFRRPLTVEEQERLLGLFKSVDAVEQPLEAAIKPTLEAVLVSPQFLFRGDPQPDSGDARAVRPVDEFALASRLSYFLWSSMPDDELFAQAAQRSLRRNLDREVKRMLQDPKARELVRNFAGQWLQLRNLRLVAPDPKQFPAFDDGLRAAMQRETELFFENICRENRSVLEFIDADYTFVNAKLARFYGIDGVEGDSFRRVNVDGVQRGGLLTQAAILTLTSNPTRTSPVKRGKWVLENILGSPPPPPPPNVPKLKEGKGVLTGSLRQRLEQHRADPNCALCHERMDPIGFGFENYDAIGAWRDRDGEFQIDASGRLVSGETFDGPAELKALLLGARRSDFVQFLTRKLLTYALGRGLEYYDTCAVDRTATNLAKDGYRFHTLVLEIVRSAPFQMKRGEPEPAQVAQAAVP
jgi:hypothetical protein